MVFFPPTFLFSLAFCFLSIERKFFVGAQSFECDVGPSALTNAFGTNVPQTCVDVPADNEESIEFRTRCFYTYVPGNCDFVEPVPLVVDLHGLGGCPLWHTFYSGWREKAEEECFVVVWPAGNNVERAAGTCFNVPGFLKSDDYGTPGGNNVTTIPCCCGPEDDDVEWIRNPESGPDDPLFIKMAIDEVLADSTVQIDSNRVYMAGHSNGCITSISMAALYSDTIAAVCCHAGALTTPFSESYFPVPIWMVHGMEDDTVRYNGASQDTPFGEFGIWSMDQTLDYMAKQNGCDDSEATETDVSEGDAVIGKTVQRKGCYADVELVALYQSGHFPYKIPVLFQSFLAGSGESATTIDTTAMAWDFCSAQNKEDIVIEVENEENEILSSSAHEDFPVRESYKMLSGVLFSMLALHSLL